jgi:NAD(P)-dependent dehydrogenase (short-subunit alcohol dehydrogenase family)
VAAAVDAYGGLDVLYNNAAVIAYGRKIAELPTADWERTLAINLTGPFLCATHAIPHLERRGGGAIINVSSHGAFQASPVGIADYGTAKGGLVTLTYYLASEYGGVGIRANCIAPGPVPTDLNSPFLATEAGRRLTAQMTRSVASETSRTSLAPRSFSPPTRRAGSPAPSFASTAASSCSSALARLARLDRARMRRPGAARQPREARARRRAY